MLKIFLFILSGNYVDLSETLILYVTDRQNCLRFNRSQSMKKYKGAS